MFIPIWTILAATLPFVPLRAPTDTIRQGTLNRALRNPAACNAARAATLWNASPGMTQAGAAVLHSTGRVSVFDLDAGKLRFFDNDGRELAALGGRGAGPGEFSARASQIEWAIDTIAVIDPATVRLTLFTRDGLASTKPLQDATLRSPALARFADGTLLFVTGSSQPGAGSNGRVRGTTAVVRYDISSGGTHTIRDSVPGTELNVFALPSRPGPVFSTVNFGYKSHVAGSRSHVVIYDDATPNLFVHSPGGALLRSLVLDMPRPPLRQVDRDSVLARVTKLAPAPDPAMSAARIAFPETRAPAELKGADASGGFWLAFREPVTSHGMVYVRIGAEGVPTHCYAPADDVRPLAFGADRIVVATEADDGDVINVVRAPVFPRK